MKKYPYQNSLIGKKQLRQLLAWSFTNYDSMQACALADEIKYLGFKYASQAGISINIEDLKIPFIKNFMLQKANQEIVNSEKIYFKGKITDVERFQKIIDTWSLSSEALKEQVIYYFKNYDPLNSVYIMAFSGARGNLSQVRQLVGMRGLMSDPSGQIMNLPIKKNFREGLTITDYLMSGYGARKGIVDTALKTANSGYLTRRLIDVGQDILIREKDCFTSDSFLFKGSKNQTQKQNLIYEKILGRVLSKSIFDPTTQELVGKADSQITPQLIVKLKEKKISEFSIRSPLTCNLYRAICQKCYGWDLANENLVDMGEAIGILAGQSIGEPGTQLTMRTFHTGGIFTSEARQQMISPVNGVIKLSKMLKIAPLRTNRGEDVLIAKNSGSIVIIPENEKQSLVQVEVLRNTILFPKNNQYITKDSVIGEIVNINKQIKTEIKPILSDTSGEIFIPKLKKKVNLLNNNKLIWILNGQVYNSPKNSFINFYPDYKLNPNSSIFRTKILNHYLGRIEKITPQGNLYQRVIRVINHKYSFFDAKLTKLNRRIQSKNYLLTGNQFKYLLNLELKKSKIYLKLTRTQQVGTLVTNSFQTLTGGTIYYDQRNWLKFNQLNKTIPYLDNVVDESDFDDEWAFQEYLEKWKSKSSICYRTLVWFAEEIHKVRCEPHLLFVEDGDFISEGFELMPGIFSKTSGMISIDQKNNLAETISIKCGLVYEGKKFKNTSRELFYPGELLLSKILIKTLSFCEPISGKNNDQLLVRPVEIYEFSHLSLNHLQNQNSLNKDAYLKLKSKVAYSYLSNQTIKSRKNLNLISHILTFNKTENWNRNTQIELLPQKQTKIIDLRTNEKLSLNHYILPKLRYKEIESCFLIQANQFIDRYTVLGYLEAITLNSLEIVKLKVKKKETKQLLLISNEDCFTVKKDQFPNKKLDDFILDSNNVRETGKVIISNDQFLTLQKGRPYFFPNCKNDKIFEKTTLQYKVFPLTRLQKRVKTDRLISLNYQNSPSLTLKNFLKSQPSVKTEFSKLFLKKNGKLYSSLIPRFFKKFSITNQKKALKYAHILLPKEAKNVTSSKLSKTLLINTAKFIKNRNQDFKTLDSQLVLMKFMEYPFPRSTKSIGLSSITEDYLEQEVNSVFSKNSQFIEAGETIGLLNLEKEITGDIVQGLPRIEEILEARKKNIITKRIPTSQKKGLLIQKTSLDQNFEFRKLGTPIKENEKINPHKLLKVYFNYYGLMKFFSCDRTNKMKYNRLLQNYEGTYKSFKKVQSFILNSVQGVYQSQGVSINNKHLEVVIKQMTTKVLITHQGNTPLLKREVVDLYHIQYINQIVDLQGKESACYIPLLLGITKSALNNPSFISAASFQETTRVLTKAAIEGRIDWLRGLKENIIIGHLIPAGTGSQTYRNSFQKPVPIKVELTPTRKFRSKARQPF
jgi:DNA-directed RNA polymerase subunit beta'